VPDDSRLALLFQCGDSNLCAVTRDETSGNLPMDACEDGWRLLESFALGVQEPVPARVQDMSISRAKLRR
jgi:hypothetical protein